MWEDVEADFLLLGISDEDYWGLPPSIIMKVAKLKREQMDRDVEERLEIARINALLSAVAMNNPRQFPSTLVKKEYKSVEGVDNTASSIIALKNKYK